jgi:hypothetical protein
LLDLGCHAMSSYPGVEDEVFEAGQISLPSAGGTPPDAAPTGDASDATGGVLPPTCPTGATVFSNANDPQTITLDSANTYWTNAPATPGLGSIGVLPRVASSAVAGTLVGGLTEPLFIANANGFVAWTGLGSVGLVSESAGTGVGTALDTSLVAAAGVAVDASNVYWVSGSSSVTVQSAPVGGGGPILVGTASGAYSAGGLSVQGGSLYFAAYSAAAGGGAIYQVASGGGVPTALQTFASGSPSDIVTDVTHIYWTDLSAGGGSVFSMPLGGGAITTMASSLGSPHHLSVDSTNVYTADSTAGSVYEIPLGSAGVTPKVLVTAIGPMGVAADDSQTVVYFTSATAICTIPK